MSSRSLTVVPWQLDDPRSVFLLISELGHGSYGVVFKAVRRDTGSLVAVKILRVETNSEEELAPLRREVELLSRTTSPLIIGFKGAWLWPTGPRSSDASELWIVMDLALCSLGELLTVSGAGEALEPVFDEPTVAEVVLLACRALAYLHKLSVIHRDLKSGNLLVDEDGRVLLSDLGVSIEGDSARRRQTVIGSPYWMSPEVIAGTGGGYDERCDVWALGITTLELLDGTPPCAEEHPLRALFLIVQNPPPTARRLVSPEAAAFIARALTRDPSARPTASELLSDPFLVEAAARVDGLGDGCRSPSLPLLLERYKPALDVRLQFSNIS